jgi:DIM1 family U5 snRNP protein
MSYLLPHLHSGWAVDQAILAEEERLVMIRFGHDWDETCMQVPTALQTLAFINSQILVVLLRVVAIPACG